MLKHVTLYSIQISVDNLLRHFLFSAASALEDTKVELFNQFGFGTKSPLFYFVYYVSSNLMRNVFLGRFHAHILFFIRE